MIRRPPSSTLFPYPTLFRSVRSDFGLSPSCAIILGQLSHICFLLPHADGREQLPMLRDYTLSVFQQWSKWGVGCSVRKVVLGSAPIWPKNNLGHFQTIKWSDPSTFTDNKNLRGCLGGHLNMKIRIFRHFMGSGWKRKSVGGINTIFAVHSWQKYRKTGLKFGKTLRNTVQRVEVYL